jgi:deoxyribonuclease IV
MADLLFGTGGVPLSAADRDLESGIRRIRELDLDCLEVEFVHGVRIKQEKAEAVGALARELGVDLTCHGPYYINLNAQEKEKKEASIRRVLETVRAGHWLGARSVTFHAGFFMGQERGAVYRVIRDELKGIALIAEQEGLKVRISPELTGKESQFGSLEELLGVAREIKGLHLCVDFAHFHARTGGAQNTYPEFCATLGAIEKALGRGELDRLHIHVAGINYTAKGERNHLKLKESDLEYGALLKALKDFKVGGWVVCESPNLEEDARLLKDTYAAV